MTSKIKKQIVNAEPVDRPAPLPLRRDTALPQPFPIAALGKVLAGAASAIIEKVQCPDAIAAQSVLAAAALATQGHADAIHPATGERHPICLFFVTVAASGERKSAADKFALEPIRLREAELYEKHQRDQQPYHDAREVHQRAREAVLRRFRGSPAEVKKQLTDLGPAPIAPLEPLLTAPDPTLEGLQKLMSIGEPSMGLFTDEGGSFLGGYGMSDEARLRTAAGLSSFWDGTPVKRVRGGDGVLILKGRRLSVHIMVQPGIARALLADPTLQSQGLPSRFLVAAPASRAGTRMQKPVSAEAEKSLKKYQTVLLKLLRKPLRRAGLGSAELDPLTIQLSPEARNQWVLVVDEFEHALGSGQMLEPIRAFAGKLAEHVVRVAAVLELIENPEAAEISAATFNRAAILGRFYASEALRLFEQGAVSIEMQRAEKLLEWLREGWGKARIGLTHVYQLGPYAIREAALARQAMAILEQHHHVVRIEGGAKFEGQRHKEAWEISATT